MNFVTTPTCPICLKCYSSSVIPRIMYPCGHGCCAECIIEYRAHNEDSDTLTCPQCRQEIEKDFNNYDLQEITNNVDTDTLNYWTRRLMEVVRPYGRNVNIRDDVKPLSRTIFTRLVFKDDYKVMGDIDEFLWSMEDRQKVKSLSKCFIEALLHSDIDTKTALNWLSVLHLSTSIENVLLNDVHKFYKCKQFLEEIEATWLMDAILD